ncbi:ABC transporter ATP-binding protein [Nonomuraea antri]|uniref:ABC transporter ATP-binding protein n=1 Tax=Nonomuraea antri TaxID=2730852 RepID=UPI001F1D0EC7|nr:ABC transporter ATP-binding protein [Nonomuraea antri]
MLAVDGIGFTIAEGETYGLLGPNGAGKTTTISMIVGILECDSGEVTIDGRAHSTKSVATKSLIGFVPQDLALYPDLTARENLRFFGRLYGLRGSALKAKVDEVLEVVGLTDRAAEPSGKFSGGMMRRLNIGVGLLNRPRVLILDEPTAGVDPQSRNAILESVGRLADEGVAVLFTTHYMEEAERLCDRVGIVDRGKLVAEGTRRELVALVEEQGRIVLRVDGDPASAVRALRTLPKIQQVSTGDGAVELLVADAGERLPSILQTTAQAGLTVRSVEVREPDLESVFLHLTGRALRD